MERLKLKLNSAESKDVFRALMELRNQCKRGGVGPLVQGKLLDHLLPLLNRTNTKIIDLSLSIIANLLLDGGARTQFRTGGGVTKLVKIINNIEEPDILRRGFRAVANASLDPKLCRLFHQNGLASTLGKRLQCSSDENTLIVLVRCVRIVADSVQYRTWLFEENIYEKLGLLMLDQGSGSGSGSNSTVEEEKNTKSELTQTLLKTIAKLTHGASVEQAEKIMPAAAVIAELSKNIHRDIWENSLMILVNLSQHSTLRPSLGNAGGVGCLIDKFNSGDLSSKETGHVITALCLYCRESVNRVKLRELGGCKVLVSILENNLTHLHNRVVNSLLQFMYDNHSLNVFMSVGLIYSLVRFIEQQNIVLKGTSNCSKKSAGEQEVAEDVIKEIKSASDETGEPAKCSDYKKIDFEEVKFEEKVKDPDLKERGEEKAKKPTEPVFRINSPSYQAVQYELEQFLQMRDTHGSASPRSGLPDYSPASPSSLLQSPDRSPLYLSCGYSPDRSVLSPDVSGFSSPTYPRSPSPTFRLQPDFCPPSSPPLSPPEASYSPPHPSSFSPPHSTYSPPLPSSSHSHMSPQHPSYSPIETFSDDESEPSVLEPSPSTETNLPAEETKDVEKTSGIPETTELPESQGSSVRNPPDDFSTPSDKKIKLSGPELPVYKYSASPITSQFIQKIILPPSFQEEPRMVSESREDVEVKEKVTPDCERLDWILQILSRLTQADRPHEDLTSTRTLSCLITLMRLDSDSLGRVTRILTRLSSNLYCMFPFLLQRHASWIMLQIEQVGEGTCCKTCKEHDLNVMKTMREVLHNLTLLTETGYGEGEICHRLVNPTFSQADKQNISVSATLLVKQRRKLQNILINHDSLETLLDIVEQEKGDLLRDAVLSLSVVAGHLGIVSPMLTLVPEEKTPCSRTGSLEAEDLVLVLDDKSEIEVGREFISSASPVFAAMLGGGFKESTKSRINIPMTSKNALNCVVHHLYKCSWCSVFHTLTAQEQLELLSLSDKFLLPELNMRISHQIIRGCLQEGFLLQVYTNSLQREYPVRCSESSLSACTVSTVLVGEMSSVARSGLVSSLIHSTLSSDFLDDVNKMLRKSLMS